MNNNIFVLIARVEYLLILIGSIKASKRSIKEPLNYFLSYCIRCKRLSVLLNSFVRKDIMPLYITAKAFYKEGNYIIKNSRDLSMRLPKFFLYRIDLRRKGKAVEDYAKGSSRIDTVAKAEDN
jgi:hypothetical protein